MTDLRAQLQSSIGDRYELGRELGGGGMSRVFTATETALGREVVVKVLPPELAAGVSTERFKREISVAARLQHPHIVPLLSAGQLDGVPWFTMPFVEGESLRARLTQRGELPVSESVRILREIASALAYAHEHGVVHRDIKPENVLLSGNVAMVADFGVAKALSASAEREGSGVTSVGVALGTPAYMAPEQATADPSTDHRADIYAFGVMAYEMLTGQTPFAGRNPSQLLAAHVTEAPEAVSRRRPNLPPTLAALVMQCLEKRAADRPQRAQDVVHALDDLATPTGGTAPTTARIPQSAVASPTTHDHTHPARRWKVAAVGIAAVVLSAAGIALWQRREPSTPDAPTAPAVDNNRIAVLPFENLGDSSDAYFAEGMTDAVRGKLTSLSNMRVIARSSSMQYRGTSKSPADIARELGVRYLLTGTVRWAKGRDGADHVQVSPELVEIEADGAASSRWQQPFDAEMADVFKVQGEIASQVASAMRVAVVGPDQARIVEVPTVVPAAYDAFLRAERIYRENADAASMRSAIALYERAIELDSNYALAWAKLARTNVALYQMTFAPPAVGRRAREAAERAMRLAPKASFALSALSGYYAAVEGDIPRSTQLIEEALAAAPNDVELISRMSSILRLKGRFAEVEQLTRAWVQLDPRGPIPVYLLAGTLLMQRRFSDAAASANRLFALAPTPSSVNVQLMVAAATGDTATLRQLIATGGTLSDVDPFLASVALNDDMGWMLLPNEQRRVLTLGPEFFDDDRASWALVRAQLHGWLGDTALMRAWGDSATRLFQQQASEAPKDAQVHGLLSLSLAYAGRGTSSVAVGDRALSLIDSATNYLIHDYIIELTIRSAVLRGDTNKALTLLEAALARPSRLSAGRLRIDPTFAPLKGNPRFEALLAQR